MVLTSATNIDFLFRAFADRTRLRILCALHAAGGEEICVCNLMTMLKLPQAKVSRHLAYLRKAGLVEVRQEKNWRYYRLSQADGEVHRKLVECLACCFSCVPEIRRDAARLGLRVASEGGCC